MNVIEWIRVCWSWIVWLRNRVCTDEKRMQEMADVLDQLKSDFEAYKASVDAALTALGDKLKVQLDPAKAQAIDDEINAAKAALNPPAPAP